MKFTSLVFAILVSSVFGLTIPSLDEASHALEKRAGFAITGATGNTVPRFEIRQLPTKAPNQWSLFLLAMQQMQAAAQTGQFSYYQLAGIHGVPRQNWDGVGQCSSCGDADGYCTHDSILFLGWHRTYLALFEQQLSTVAKQIANTYPASSKATMVAAAAKLRLPFWDWAARPASGSSLPVQITAQTVSVNTPTGQKTINNPLFKHTFSSPSNLRYTPFVSWPSTLRYPTSNAADARSQNPKAVSAFDNIRASLQDQLYQIFSTCDTFTEVGSDAKGQSSNACSNSFEGLHNTVHTTAGGPGVKGGTSGGHMTYLATAAFDPIFWLHHCNVDRLFAMWQAVNPNSYGGSQVAPHNTWTIAQGSTQNAGSPLTPFHKDTSGNFWTTTAVRDWKVFHYTYPEFADSDGSKASISKYINQLYGPSASATAGSSKRDTTPLVANNGSLFQYVANIQTARYALAGSYQIYLFNGKPASEDPTTWITDANLIGPMGVLAQDKMKDSNLVATGSIPLTRTLTDQVTSGLLAELTPILVVPYLTKNLVWRVAGPTGLEVDPTTIPDFEISVFSSTASPVSEFELPTWSKFIELAEITDNKAGGANATGTDTNSTSSATTSSATTGTATLTGEATSTATTGAATTTI